MTQLRKTEYAPKKEEAPCASDTPPLPPQLMVQLRKAPDHSPQPKDEEISSAAFALGPQLLRKTEHTPKEPNPTTAAADGSPQLMTQLRKTERNAPRQQANPEDSLEPPLIAMHQLRKTVPRQAQKATKEEEDAEAADVPRRMAQLKKTEHPRKPKQQQEKEEAVPFFVAQLRKTEPKPPKEENYNHSPKLTAVQLRKTDRTATPTTNKQAEEKTPADNDTQQPQPSSLEPASVAIHF